MNANGGKALSTTAEALKGNPMLLGILLINLVFLGVLYWTLTRIGDGMRARDAALIELLKECRRGAG